MNSASSNSPSLPEVLVVDDNELNRRLMLHLLNRTGYSARGAGSGAEALQILEEQRIPVILMDCHMPGLDGYETTARIRESEAARQGEARARIIAVTADQFFGVRERCLAAGMDDYLSKPLSPERFRETMAQIFTPGHSAPFSE